MSTSPATAHDRRVALGAHLDTVARLRAALGPGPETDLLIELVQAAGCATSWGRRDVDDMCGDVLRTYRDVLRGPGLPT